jgi:hypothetical protein
MSKTHNHRFDFTRRGADDVKDDNEIRYAAFVGSGLRARSALVAMAAFAEYGAFFFFFQRDIGYAENIG